MWNAIIPDIVKLIESENIGKFPTYSACEKIESIIMFIFLPRT